jgi:predicted dithiol-disulfide oxidoreductase (DUF899 family)
MTPGASTYLPEVVSREEWLAARRELLVPEARRVPPADGLDISLVLLVRQRLQLRLHATGYRYLDLTALGRQEAWEEPKGRAVPLGLHVGGPAMRLPDEYDT